MRPSILHLLCFLAPSICACARDDVTEGQTTLPILHSFVDESPMPGPNRGRLDAAVKANDACIVCHDEQAREWRGSLHQRADIDPAYRQAFAIEPLPFCRGCHAPEGDSQHDAPTSVREIGVACVTCHVTEDGVVLAAPSKSLDSAPHPLRRSAAFGSTGACANCHEFPFPGIAAGPQENDAWFMQTTIREHARSEGENTSCADCHMPIIHGKRSHSFAQVRDAEWLRKNIVVDARKGEMDSLEITLRQTRSGHAFPTGDLFRRLEVAAELRDKYGHVVRKDARYPGRHFVQRPGAAGRTLQRDDRLFDTPVVIELDMGPTNSSSGPWKVFYWVKLQRVATVGDGLQIQDSVVESDVELQTGELSW